MSKYFCKVDPELEYETIDYNWSNRPIGYCHYHRGYITSKQVKIHNCLKKCPGGCNRFEALDCTFFRENPELLPKIYDKSILF